MNRSKKQENVAYLSSIFSASSIVVVAHNNGLTVKQFNTLRRGVNKINSKCIVAKNSLAKLAVKDSDYETSLGSLLSGPIMLIYSEGDPTALSKSLVNFCKENQKIKLLGGAITNKHIDVETINTLASLPSIDGLRSEIVSIIAAPLASLVRVIAAPSEQLVRTIDAYADKKVS